MTGLWNAGATNSGFTDVFHMDWARGVKVRVLANIVTRSERGDPLGKARVVIGDKEGRPVSPACRDMKS